MKKQPMASVRTHKTSQASVLQLIPLDCSVAWTLDTLDCHIVRKLDH